MSPYFPNGLYHGVSSKYLSQYLAEGMYRFNRHHDLDGLWHRALTACARATPLTRPVLTG